MFITDYMLDQIFVFLFNLPALRPLILPKTEFFMHRVLANVYLKDRSDNVSKKTSTSFIEERILANSFNFSELKR